MNIERRTNCPVFTWSINISNSW